jgi:hypothetical protein
MRRNKSSRCAQSHGRIHYQRVPVILPQLGEAEPVKKLWILRLRREWPGDEGEIQISQNNF